MPRAQSSEMRWGVSQFAGVPPLPQVAVWQVRWGMLYSMGVPPVPRVGVRQYLVPKGREQAKDPDTGEKQRADNATRAVEAAMQGQISRAARHLTSTAVLPGNDSTRQEVGRLLRPAHRQPPRTDWIRDYKPYAAPLGAKELACTVRELAKQQQPLKNWGKVSNGVGMIVIFSKSWEVVHARARASTSPPQASTCVYEPPRAPHERPRACTTPPRASTRVHEPSTSVHARPCACTSVHEPPRALHEPPRASTSVHAFPR
eukprot:gene11071-biopygen10880